MHLFERTRATGLQANDTRRAFIKPIWQGLGVGLAVGAYLFVVAPGQAPANAQPGVAHVASGHVAGDAKKAERDAKRAEKAAARAAKKKEKQARAHKSDDELAKAKSSKNKGNSVDLGDDDPLEGL
ncbi:MAG TPA: hypothetical protein VJR89_20490 [Polyangiales bacterium]|nr:hypothetical protein [Polyangiales bacterium]